MRRCILQNRRRASRSRSSTARCAAFRHAGAAERQHRVSADRAKVLSRHVRPETTSSVPVAEVDVVGDARGGVERQCASRSAVKAGGPSSRSRELMVRPLACQRAEGAATSTSPIAEPPERHAAARAPALERQATCTPTGRAALAATSWLRNASAQTMRRSRQISRAGAPVARNATEIHLRGGETLPLDSRRHPLVAGERLRGDPDARDHPGSGRARPGPVAEQRQQRHAHGPRRPARDRDDRKRKGWGGEHPREPAPHPGAWAEQRVLARP